MALTQQSGRKSTDELVVMDEESSWHTTIDHQEGIRWTRHSLERYYERTPEHSATHDTAFRNGINAQYALPHFRNPQHNRFPEVVRLYDHGPCATVMIVEDGVVVTAKTVSMIHDAAVRSYCYTLLNLHQNGSLINNTEMYGESPTRVEQINIRENST